MGVELVEAVVEGVVVEDVARRHRAQVAVAVQVAVADLLLAEPAAVRLLVARLHFPAEPRHLLEADLDVADVAPVHLVVHLLVRRVLVAGRHVAEIVSLAPQPVRQRLRQPLRVVRRHFRLRTLHQVFHQVFFVAVLGALHRRDRPDRPGLRRRRGLLRDRALRRFRGGFRRGDRLARLARFDLRVLVRLRLRGLFLLDGLLDGLLHGLHLVDLPVRRDAPAHAGTRRRRHRRRLPGRPGRGAPRPSQCQCHAQNGQIADVLHGISPCLFTSAGRRPPRRGYPARHGPMPSLPASPIGYEPPATPLPTSCNAMRGPPPPAFCPAGAVARRMFHPGFRFLSCHPDM